MPILQVFSKNIQTTYKSALFSKAALVAILCGVFSIVTPFLLAYHSKGFWLKQDVFFEQPSVKFKGDYILLGTTNNLSLPLVCTSFPQIQKGDDFLDACQNTKVREVDENFDFKPDEWEFVFKIVLPSKNLHLTSISLILEFDFKLTNLCRLQMKSLVIHNQFLPIPVTDFMAVGDVSVVQSEPLKCKKHGVHNRYNYSTIGDVKYLDYTKINDIIVEYSKRTVSTKLHDIYTNFKAGSSETVRLNIKLRLKEIGVVFEPAFWQIMKWAWVQYYAIYIIVSYVVVTIKTYIFNNRLVLFYEYSPVIDKNK